MVSRDSRRPESRAGGGRSRTSPVGWQTPTGSEPALCDSTEALMDPALGLGPCYRQRVDRRGSFFSVAVARCLLRFQLPPVKPCMRFSRTRLTDVLRRRHSAFPGPEGSGWYYVSVEADQAQMIRRQRHTGSSQYWTSTPCCAVFHTRSSRCMHTLQSSGDAGPPCGVPDTERRTAPSCIPLVGSITRRSFRTAWSLTRFSTACINFSCGIAVGRLLVGKDAAETAGELDRAGRGPVGLTAGRDNLLGSAGAPAHSDADAVTVVFGPDGDVGANRYLSPAQRQQLRGTVPWVVRNALSCR